MNNGEKKLPYSYSFYDKIKIWQSNLFWRVVDILSFKLTKVAKIYDNVIKEYEREIEIFEISESKKILHIGCGSYPITAYTLSNMSKGEIVCIDKSNKAIKRSVRYISDKNLNERISIKHGDGASFPLEGFDTIIISSCSIPKFRILEHLFNNAPPNCKIVVREQPGPGNFVSEYIELCSDKVDVVKKVDNKAFPTAKWDSYCLLKKGEKN